MTTIHARQIQFAKMHIGETTPYEERFVFDFLINYMVYWKGTFVCILQFVVLHL